MPKLADVTFLRSVGHGLFWIKGNWMKSVCLITADELEKIQELVDKGMSEEEAFSRVVKPEVM